MHLSTIVFCLVLIATSFLIAPAQQVSVLAPTASGTLRDVLVNQKATAFIALIQKANLTSLIDSNSSTLTVFAPNNDALKKFDVPSSELVALVQYHFTQGRVTTPALSNGLLIPSILKLASLDGGFQQLKIKIKKEKHKTDIQVNGADILIADKSATNGVVQIIKQVLTPPQNVAVVAHKKEKDSLSIFYNVTSALNLTTILANQSDLTVFAPTNDAFQLNSALVGYLRLPINTQELNSTLLNHVVPHTYYGKDFPNNSTLSLTTAAKNEISVHTIDGRVTINNASVVTKADVLASNGVIHEISGILTLPSFVFTFEKALLGLNDTEFLSELNATGLLAVLLNTTEQYTLFAPSNKAWAKSEPKLSSKPLKDRISILQRHIVKGSYSELKDGHKLENLNGNHLVVFHNKTTTSVHLNDYTGDFTKVLGRVGTPENGVVYTVSEVIPALEEDEPLDELIVIIVVCVCVPLLLLVLAVAVVIDLRRWIIKRRALSYTAINYA
eukprot:TRINITY_DN1016_c0_g1_i2.p1 TRINITY_DN1016_c0_g1~~TRINITY_DN1016_c0_g1_i2.p1  ORF type:complete len:500 (+),score=85.12 TRINITY_DN1016_c0_g1_i2:129-1628(+)